MSTRKEDYFSKFYGNHEEQMFCEVVIKSKKQVKNRKNLFQKSIHKYKTKSLNCCKIC